MSPRTIAFLVFLLLFSLTYAGAAVYALVTKRARMFWILFVGPLVLGVSLTGVLILASQRANAGMEGVYVLFVIAELVILFCLTYVATTVYLLAKRRWRIFLPMFLVPVLIAGVLAGMLQMKVTRENTAYYTGLFDVPLTTLGRPLYSYHTEHGFVGSDGYSIDVYELPAAIRKRFSAPDARLLSEYPHYPEYGNSWGRMTWTEGPLDPKLNWYVDFVYGAAWGHNRVPEIKRNQDALRAALNRKGVFFAYFYHAWSRMFNIDFFLIDLTENKLYVIINNDH